MTLKSLNIRYVKLIRRSGGCTIQPLDRVQRFEHRPGRTIRTHRRELTRRGLYLQSPERELGRDAKADRERRRGV